MTMQRDPDEILSAWLDEGPMRLPGQTRRAITVAIPMTSQRRRAINVPWRFSTMSATFKLALGTAALIAVVVVGAFFLGPPSSTNVGGAPNPTPSATASPTASPAPQTPSSDLLDTSTWTTYVSERYGFSIAYPADWRSDDRPPPDHDWTLANDTPSFESTATENFVLPIENQGIRVSAWSVAVDPGTTVEAWIEAYCTAEGAPCPNVSDLAIEVIEGGSLQRVLLVNVADAPHAFFLNADRILVIACWQSDDAPSVAKYGGSLRLTQAFASTMVLNVPAPASSPEANPSPS